MTPCTTFANGINPFLPLTQPPAMTKITPAKPAKTKPAIEDYGTQYQPPVALIKATAPPENFGMEITHDPLPNTRCQVVFKYKAVFEQLPMGACLRLPSDEVYTRSNVLRDWIVAVGKTAHVRSTQLYTYPDGRADVQDGIAYGRVWMLSGLPPKKPTKTATK